MTMICSEPSGAKRFCSSISETKPRRLRLYRDQCVPSGVVHSDTWPCRAAPPLDVIAHTFASAGGLGSCFVGVPAGGASANVGGAKRETAKAAKIFFIGFVPFFPPPPPVLS